MADGGEVVLGVIGAVVAAKIASKVAGATWRGGKRVVGAAGGVVGAAVTNALVENARQTAFDGGLNNGLPPRVTDSAELNSELDRCYAAGERERERRISAVAQVVRVQLSHNQYVINGPDDD